MRKLLALASPSGHAFATPAALIPRARVTLLAGASLVVLAALGAPGPVRAACTGADQIFSVPTLGPVSSTGGAITVSSSGSIQGGPTGVDASTCSVTQLTNSGAI